MSNRVYTRPLLTFAFVSQEFAKSGDVIQGLMPLFTPIFAEMSGNIFSPQAFSEKVEAFYGLRMHPYVAEDWVPRFEAAGLLEEIRGDKFSRTYRCKPQSLIQPDQNVFPVAEIVDELTNHTNRRLRDRGIEIGLPAIEHGIIERLSKPEFIALLGRPQKTFPKAPKLTLSARVPDETVDPESAIDFILAERLIVLSQTNRARFEEIAAIAGGALVSEVILSLRSPPKRGQTIGSEIFIDSPLIIDLLDLSDLNQHQYAKLLIDDLKKMGAYLRTFEHNVEEIRGIIDGALRMAGAVKSAGGTVAYRLRTDNIAISRAQMFRQSPTKHISSLGIQIVNMESSTRQQTKYFPPEKITDLTAGIRPFGEIYSREVDAKSVAGVSRKVLGRSAVANVFSLPAIFLTKNNTLANRALSFIRTDYAYSEEAASPFVTDRQMAGLVWLARGGDAGDVTGSQLLANCTRAIAPRRDVIARVYEFLAETDENSAKEFEALMVEDRCTHYVMNYTMGDAALVTKDNAPHILEDVKRTAIEATLAQSDAAHRADLEARRTETEQLLLQKQEEHEAELAELSLQMHQQKEAAAVQSAEVTKRDEAIAALTDARTAQAEALQQSNTTIIALERATITTCSDAAHAYVNRLTLALSLGASFLLALVGVIGSCFTGVITERFWIVATIALTTLLVWLITFSITWTIPDLLFGARLKRLWHEKYAKEVIRRGAESYKHRWVVDWRDKEKPPALPTALSGPASPP